MYCRLTITQPQTFDRIAHLKPIPDYRKAKGRRHELWLVLILVLLGTLWGDRGYPPLVDFSAQHWPSLCALLDLPTDTRIPSDSTCRRVLQQVDFAPLVTLFNQ